MRGTVKTVAALGVVALLAAGCAKPASSGKTPTAATAKFKACMVTDIGGINDKSFNQSSWAGMEAAQSAESNKIHSIYLPSNSSADYAKNITAFENEKCGIIVTVGFLMGPATQSAALADPKQDFAIVDCSYASFCLSTKPHPPVAKNIDQLVFNTVQDAFLSGYLAAGMSKTHVVATYGGAQFGTVTIYEDGFWDGVQYYNQHHHANVKVLGWNEKTQKGVFVGGSNPFGDQAAGARITNTFISSGADIIFPVAGGDGLGSAAAIKSADANGKHVYMYWVDTDGCVSAASYCSYFITSVEKGLASAVQTAVQDAANGTFHGGTFVGTLANGGAILAPFHAPWTTKVPAALQAELKTLAQQIESGAIVPATKSPV
ncbi:MAG TPA: BMP family ABC transporter substrate-binding protein [Streptosporangiaceae bacterium]|nr:BMP family ABC transporter substrate-binding protein [Streptosporangiaceae bacterium]